MATNRVRHQRSATPAAVPTDLLSGELAINLADRKLYSNNGSDIVLINGVVGSNTQVLFNDSGLANASAGMIFDKATNNFTIANTILVGANVTVNTSVLKIGNSTVNVAVNSSLMTFNGISFRNATLLASGSFPAAATLDITSISGNYSTLIIQANGVSCGTASRQFMMQVSSNNGSTFDTTQGNYGGTRADLGNAGGPVPMSLASLIEGPIQAAAATSNATVMIFGYASGGNGFGKHWMAVVDSVSGLYPGTGFYKAGHSGAINAIRFLWNGSGNFDAGTYQILGM